MTLTFTDTRPDTSVLNPVLISGPMSIDCSGRTFIILSNKNELKGLFEIKYDIHCSSFREALLIDHLLAVGHEGYFYLFNTTTNQTILRLAMDGYFGHLYYNNELFYIADANGIHCINKSGEVLWKNSELAIDGVIIHEFTDDRISGSGEFNPPGGWVDFSIEKETGKKDDNAAH